MWANIYDQIVRQRCAHTYELAYKIYFLDHSVLIGVSSQIWYIFEVSVLSYEFAHMHDITVIAQYRHTSELI